MDCAHHGPGAAANVGVEFHPIRGIDPRARHSAARGAVPTRATVIAREQADIGVRNENAPPVEGVEMHPVTSGDVEAVGGPASVGRALGVDSVPGFATIRGTHGAAVVGAVTDVRFARRYPERPRIAGPARAEARR